MAKKSRPSFEGSRPSSPARKPTGWVYRSTRAEAPSDAPVTQPGVNVQMTEAVAPVVLPPERADHHSRAMEIVKRFSTYSAGGGLVPLPWLDVVIIGGVQWKMVRALAEEYGVPFDRQRIKTALGAAFGALSATELGYVAGGSAMKSIPVLGALIGAAAVPASAYAVSYAIGRMFMSHFAAGGTLFNVDTARFRKYFTRQSGPALAAQR